MLCESTAITYCDPTTNALQIQGAFEGTYSYVYAPGPVKFTITNMTNRETSDKINFAVSTYNLIGNNYLIDESNLMFSMSFTTGIMTVNSITPNDREI